MKQSKNKNRFQFIPILIIIILFIYAIIDASYTQPQNRKKIDSVSIEFSKMQTYLDDKIPEIDSFLIDHTQKINEQNKELKKISKLAKSINRK
jgi:uncharacterized protein YfbU (UPF0304 family)